MPNVYAFDSDEDMMAALTVMVRDGQEAMKTHPVKVVDLHPGDHVVSLRPDLGVVIYGEICSDLPEDDEVADDTANGYVFGRYFSPFCVEGELGYAHVTRINGKISKEAFERARVNGWRPKPAH